MNKALRISMNILRVALVLLVLAFVGMCVYAQYKFDKLGTPDRSETMNHATVTINGETQTRQLPCVIEVDEPRTKVTVEVQLGTVESHDTVYLKTVYCPLSVELDGEKLADMGDLSMYPSFMRDPGTEVRFVDLPADGSGKTLTLTYLSPVGRNEVAIYPPIVGRTEATTSSLQRIMGAPQMLSIVQIIVGVMILLVAFSVVNKKTEFSAGFWLGLFVICSGMWGLCENNLTGIDIHEPGALYILCFMGFDCAIVPFLVCIRRLADIEMNRWYSLIEMASLIAPMVAFLLEVLGVMPLYRSFTFFKVELALALAGVFVYGLVRWYKRRDMMAIHIMVSMGILGVGAILEKFALYMEQHGLLFSGTAVIRTVRGLLLHLVYL